MRYGQRILTLDGYQHRSCRNYKTKSLLITDIRIVLQKFRECFKVNGIFSCMTPGNTSNIQLRVVVLPRCRLKFERRVSTCSCPQFE